MASANGRMDGNVVYRCPRRRKRHAAKSSFRNRNETIVILPLQQLIGNITLFMDQRSGSALFADVGSSPKNIVRILYTCGMARSIRQQQPSADIRKQLDVVCDCYIAFIYENCHVCMLKKLITGPEWDTKYLHSKKTILFLDPHLTSRRDVSSRSILKNNG